MVVTLFGLVLGKFTSFRQEDKAFFLLTKENAQNFNLKYVDVFFTK